MRTIAFAACEVRVWDDLRALQTHFPDGSYVPAAPKHDDEQAALARAHGYGADVWALVRDHEVCHTLVGEALGHPHSPTLWYVAHPGSPEPDWAAEEALVLALQAALNGAEPDVALWNAFGEGLAPLLRRARSLLRPAGRPVGDPECA